MKKRKISTATVVYAVLVCVACAVPYIVSGYADNIIDALFESCSGLTTTGATVFYANLDELPPWLLVYRSLTNWIGGLAMLLFIFYENKKRVAFLYSALTVSLFIGLRLAKMSFVDSVCYSLSTMSTGGFTTTRAGITDPVCQIIIIIFMLIAVLDYSILLSVKRKGLKIVFKDHENLFFISSFALISCLIFIFNCIFSSFNVNAKTMLLDSAFQVASIISTTGYVSTNYMNWPLVSIMLLLALFFINGCTNSPSGGIKCYRIIVCLKLIKRSFTLKVHPNRIAPLTYNNSELRTDSAIGATSYILTYLAALLFSTILLSLSNCDFITCFSSALSLLSNTGAAMPVDAISIVYSNLSGCLKLMCPVIMILGRVEFTIILMLFSKFYWNPNRG